MVYTITHRKNKDVEDEIKKTGTVLQTLKAPLSPYWMTKIDTDYKIDDILKIPGVVGIYN